MIKRTIARLLGAGSLCLLGLGLMGGRADNPVGVGLIVIGFLWGTLELFVLSAQLLMYGLTGIAHDIGQWQERDPWNRW